MIMSLDVGALIGGTLAAVFADVLTPVEPAGRNWPPWVPWVVAGWE